MRMRIGGSRRRGGGTPMARESAAVARVLRGEAKRAHPGAADIARARLSDDKEKEKRRRHPHRRHVPKSRSTGPDGGNEQSSRGGGDLPSSDIAHIPLDEEHHSRRHRRRRQSSSLDGSHHVDTCARDKRRTHRHGGSRRHRHRPRSLSRTPDKASAPRRYRMGWVLPLGIDRLIRGSPVSLHWRRTTPTISLNDSLSYAAKSKGRKEPHRLKSR